MARSAIVPGLSASIHIANSPDPAPEITDPDEKSVINIDPIVAKYQTNRIVSKYIEVNEGDTFAIHVSVGAPIVQNHTMKYTKLGFHITVDGHLAWEPRCSRPWFKKNEDENEWAEKVTGLKEGKGRNCTERVFQFAKIETDDTELALVNLKRAADKMKAVGLIEVKVYSEDYGQQGGDVPTDHKKFAGKAKVPEMVLKGEVKDQRTELGEPIKTARGEVWRTNKKDGEDYPLVIFRFFYRSKRALQILDLVERTPSPEPEDGSGSPSVEVIDQSDADSDPESDGEDDDMAADRRELAAILTRLKSRRNGKGKGKGKAIKRKMSSRGARKIKKEKTDGERCANKRRKNNNSQPKVVVIDDDTENESEDGEGLFVPEVPNQNSQVSTIL